MRWHYLLNPIALLSSVQLKRSSMSLLLKLCSKCIFFFSKPHSFFILLYNYELRVSAHDWEMQCMCFFIWSSWLDIFQCMSIVLNHFWTIYFFLSIVHSQDLSRVTISSCNAIDKPPPLSIALWPAQMGLAFLYCQIHGVFILYFAAEQW